jgi:GTP pyrophosphokinase
VEGVWRLERTRWDRLEEEAAESLRRMFLAMAAEVRVVIIGLAARVRKMRALGDEPDPERRRRVAHETMQVFAPLANRLGIWQLKSELEDLSLRELQPEAYAELVTLLEERRRERTGFIEEAARVLREKLAEQGLEALVKGRAKHLSSILRKIQRKKVGLDQIHDVSGVRVITAEVKDCYAVLGLVHSLWVPLPGKFDDYIARPKDNLYQSLHTTVMGPGAKPLEVQIRTHQMHEYAEYGVAAHWAYKEGRKAIRSSDKKFMVLRQLMDWEREVADPHQFAESLKTDVFKDQVFVFTPAGDIVDLPLGSTPLDFAYRVHTMVGHRCRGARVNDQIVPLDYQLKTGDRVEVLTHKHPQPSRDWLSPGFGYLHTAGARGKVRGWFRQQDRGEAVEQGRAIVEREIARLGLAHATAEDIAAALEYASLEDLFAAVGFGDRSAHSVASAGLSIERQKAPPPPSEPPQLAPEPAPSRNKATSGLSLRGVDDVLGKRARCCNPLPGDRVVGYISRGRGITIHRSDCAQARRRTEPERWVEIDWGPGRDERYSVEVEILANDRPGLLRDISELLAQSGVDVRAARAEAREKRGMARLRFVIELGGSDQVAHVLGRLDRQPGVVQVRRVAG